MLFCWWKSLFKLLIKLLMLRVQKENQYLMTIFALFSLLWCNQAVLFCFGKNHRFSEFNILVQQQLETTVGHTGLLAWHYSHLKIKALIRPLYRLLRPSSVQPTHLHPSFRFNDKISTSEIPLWGTLSFIPPHYLTPSSSHNIWSAVYCRKLKKQRRRTTSFLHSSINLSMWHQRRQRDFHFTFQSISSLLWRVSNKRTLLSYHHN